MKGAAGGHDGSGDVGIHAPFVASGGAGMLRALAAAAEPAALVTLMNKLLASALLLVPLLVACPPPTTGAADSGVPDGGSSPGPRVIGISPTEGPIAGGTVVLVTGDFFVEGTKVFFNTTEALEVTYTTAKRLSAKTPPVSAEGAVDVRVLNPDGRSATLAGAFTYTGESGPTISEAKLSGDAVISDQSGNDPVVFTVRADVEVAGVTAGGGQGQGVRAQVGYVANTGTAMLSEITWTDAQYEGDADGASQGDQARDRYAGQISVAGATGTEVKSYLLAARFSTNDGASWTVADLDGASNGSTVAQLQRLDVSQNRPDWCKLGGEVVSDPPQVTLKTGQMGPVIYAQIYEGGVTNAGGQGANLAVELGYGAPGSDPAAGGWTWSSASYNTDTGSGANDEYQATLPNPGDGTYSFAYRAAVNGGAWRYCDANGSGADTDFEVAQAGTLTVSAASVDKCKVQFPATLEAREGVATDKVYGWVWAAGITDAVGQGSGIVAELGYGPAGTQPTDATWTWTWTAAAYNASTGDKDNGQADEYEAALTGPVPGTYHYAFRFSVGSGQKTYCDLDGSDVGGFTSAQAGVLTSKALDVDACALMGPASYGVVTGGTTAAIAGQVTAATITDGMGAGAGITAEVGYGAAGTPPSTWTWSAATYASDQNMGASDEYLAALTPTTVGTYKVAYRFRYANNAFVYCDRDGSANGFDEAQAATLTVGYACRMVAVTEPGGTTAVNSTESGVPLEVSAAILIPGVTSQPGATMGVVGQVGVGTDGTDAATDPAWGWQDAAFKMDTSGTGEDVFAASFNAAYTGSRAVSFRFSTDNRQSWTYCDLDGNSNGYSAAQQSTLLVNKPSAATADTIDFCKLQFPQTVTSQPATLYGRVYEAGATDTTSNGGGLIVEWGWGNKIEDPAVAWTWSPASFNVDVGNDDEWMASLNGLPAGTWSYAFRFRRAGTSTPWCYGDLDGNGGNTGLNGFNGETTDAAVCGTQTTPCPNLGLATLP